MKYIDEYRDSWLISKLTEQIRKSSTGSYTFMEVCGGHTAAIHRFGIPSLLPENIRLISGPGCPVCVTATDFIDKAVAYAGMNGFIIAVFGDLLRIPGSDSTLEKAKASGADVRIVLSALDALDIAAASPDRKVIFPAIGFETTAPGTAVTIKQAARSKVNNFFVMCGHKVMPPAMEAIIREGVKIDGFICPGHVATITGSSVFDFIACKYQLGCAVAGFEPVDILQSVLMLVQQINRKLPVVEIQYNRAVTRDGNPIAKRNMAEVFMPCDTPWRGFGFIPSGGLSLREEYRKHDIEYSLPLNIKSSEGNRHCICGDILRGLKTPGDCSLFGRKCTPESPVGACMVSPEGSCNTWHKYKLADG